MSAITIKGLRLGEGMPKICIPLVGETPQRLEQELAAALAAGADMLEWRADVMLAALGKDGRGGEELLAFLVVLRGLAGRTPLLFTLRTTAEGGRCSLPAVETAKLLARAAESGMADLVDAEAALGEPACALVKKGASGNDAKLVLSHHSFTHTPPRRELLERLCAMQDMGADIVKLAVMPNSPADTLALMAATGEYMQRPDSVPAITMAMGPLGVLSRVGGELYGSCLSFGSAAAASAPGQLPAKALRGTLEILHAGMAEKGAAE